MNNILSAFNTSENLMIATLPKMVDKSYLSKRFGLQNSVLHFLNYHILPRTCHIMSGAQFCSRKAKNTIFHFHGSATFSGIYWTF